jgi:hypothetical protein
VQREVRQTEGEAITVVGMHRSGTSVTVRILNLLGVPLGDEATMLDPRPDNPEGFWEQRAVAGFNDDLLAALDRAWEDPRPLPPGWEDAPELEQFRERAGELVDDHFGGLPTWGWKDPRLSILLPFWLRVVPGMRFVVCVRNPVDVVRSLEAREGDMDGLAGDLWLQYTAAALRHTSGRPRLILSVEDLFERRDEALHRLAAFIGRNPAAVGSDERERVDAYLDDRQWHHRSSTADVLSARELPTEAKLLYLVLEEARELPAETMAAALADGRSAATRVTELEGELEALTQELRQLREQSAAERAAAEREAAALGRRIEELEQLLDRHVGWLHDIEGSASWRLTSPLRAAKRLIVGRRESQVARELPD